MKNNRYVKNLMKNNPYVANLMPSEQAFLKGLFRVGGMTKEQAKEQYGITPDRMRKMENTRFIETSEEKIIIDDKGIQECKELGLESGHRYGSGSFRTFEHDNRVAEVYFSIETDKDIENKWEKFQENERLRDGWIPEKELLERAEQSEKYENFKDRMIESHSKGKCQATPDAAYRHPDTNVITCIEITTDNYKDEDIAQKVEFAREFYHGNIEVY